MDAKSRFTVVTCQIDMRFSTGNLDRSIQLLCSVVGPTQVKSGCKACEVARDLNEDCLLHYGERWDSQASFERHVKSEEFRRVLVAMDMCCEEPRVILGNLSGHSGMAYLRKFREPQGDGVE